MDPNISIYNSYRKSLNTITGSFPVYSNFTAGCVTNKDLALETSLSLLALDETVGLFYIIREFSPSSPLYDPFSDVDILIDVNSLTIDPNTEEQIYTYNLII